MNTNYTVLNDNHFFMNHVARLYESKNDSVEFPNGTIVRTYYVAFLSPEKADYDRTEKVLQKAGLGGYEKGLPDSSAVAVYPVNALDEDEGVIVWQNPTL